MYICNRTHTCSCVCLRVSVCLCVCAWVCLRVRVRVLRPIAFIFFKVQHSLQMRLATFTQFKMAALTSQARTDFRNWSFYFDFYRNSSDRKKCEDANDFRSKIPDFSEFLFACIGAFLLKCFRKWKRKSSQVLLFMSVLLLWDFFCDVYPWAARQVVPQNDLYM